MVVVVVVPIRETEGDEWLEFNSFSIFFAFCFFVLRFKI